jgi:hypothetical protein
VAPIQATAEETAALVAARKLQEVVVIGRAVAAALADTRVLAVKVVSEALIAREPLRVPQEVAGVAAVAQAAVAIPHGVAAASAFLGKAHQAQQVERRVRVIPVPAVLEHFMVVVALVLKPALAGQFVSFGRVHRAHSHRLIRGTSNA